MRFLSPPRYCTAVSGGYNSLRATIQAGQPRRGLEFSSAGISTISIRSRFLVVCVTVAGFSCSRAENQSRVVTKEFSLFVWSLAFSPNASQVAVAGEDGVRIYDVDTGECNGWLPAPGTDKFPRVAWSPAGDLIAIGSNSKEITLWDPATKKRLFRFPVWDEMQSVSHVGSIVFSPDGRKVAWSGRGLIRVFDSAKRAPWPCLLASPVVLRFRLTARLSTLVTMQAS